MDKREKEDLFGCIGTILVTLLIVGGIVACVHYKDYIVEGNVFKSEILERHNLVAIQNSSFTESKLSGAFFVMIGSVDASTNRNEVVYVYEETNFGTFKMNKYSYDDVEFKFINSNETPYIERCYKVRIDTIMKYDGTPKHTFKYYKPKPHYSGPEKRYTKSFYILHVPKQSIINTFDLNIENLK